MITFLIVWLLACAVFLWLLMVANSNRETPPVTFQEWFEYKLAMQQQAERKRK